MRIADWFVSCIRNHLALLAILIFKNNGIIAGRLATEIVRTDKRTIAADFFFKDNFCFDYSK